MSQHRYSIQREGNTIRVLAGWDRPLQMVFCNVEQEPTKSEGFDSLPEAEKQAYWARCDEESVFLFDNLITPLSCVDEIGEILATLKIPIPKGFLTEIEKDKQCNAGNRIESYEVSVV